MFHTIVTILQRPKKGYTRWTQIRVIGRTAPFASTHSAPMLRLVYALVIFMGLIASITLAASVPVDAEQKQLEVDAKIAQLDAMIKAAGEEKGPAPRRGLVREEQQGRRGGGRGSGGNFQTPGGSNRSGND